MPSAPRVYASLKSSLVPSAVATSPALPKEVLTLVMHDTMAKIAITPKLKETVSTLIDTC